MIMVIMIHYCRNYALQIDGSYLSNGYSIFFVCSGFGIISLINKKYPDISSNKRELGSYYLSRIETLAIGRYLAFIIMFLLNTISIYMMKRNIGFGDNRDFSSILINLLFLNGLFLHACNNVMPGGWYIGTTIVLYFLTPAVLRLLNKTSKKSISFLAVLQCVLLYGWF